jgi:hypothetical protein
MQELPPGFRIVGAPQSGDPVIAPPNPYKEREANRQDRALDIQEQNAVVQSQLNSIELNKARAEDQEREQRKADIATKEQEVLQDTLRRIELIDEVYADATNEGTLFGSTGEVGYLGNALSETSGTAAFDLAAKISTIQGVEAIDKLLEVKSDPRNPTGGAFGALSDQELRLLKNYTASIEQGQSYEEFARGLGRIKRAALDIVKKMDPAAYEQIINRGSPKFNADGSITYDKLGESLFGVPAAASPSGTAPQGGSDLQNLMQKYGGR